MKQYRIREITSWRALEIHKPCEHILQGQWQWELKVKPVGEPGAPHPCFGSPVQLRHRVSGSPRASPTSGTSPPSTPGRVWADTDSTDTHVLYRKQTGRKVPQDFSGSFKQWDFSIFIFCSWFLDKKKITEFISWATLPRIEFGPPIKSVLYQVQNLIELMIK